MDAIEKKKEFITMFTPIEPHFLVPLKDCTTSAVLTTIPSNTHPEDVKKSKYYFNKSQFSYVSS